MNATATPQQIRKNIRQARRTLSPAQQQAASEAFLQQAIKIPAIIEAQTLSAYLAVDGELDLMPFIRWCWSKQKRIVLPVIHPFSPGNLLFLNYHPDTSLTANQYGINEPLLRCQDVVPLANIDILLTPLVAFDRQGNRLGMGGGYYDRTLAIARRRYSTPPRAIGVAHNCQQVQSLARQPWDQPINQLITPQQCFNWENS